jgi:pilus assembly protein CpaE
MRHALRILLVGRPGLPLSQVDALLAEHRQLNVTTQLVSANQTGFLSDPQEHSDAIVLVLAEDWHGTLTACFRRDAPALKPLLVVGPTGDTELMRMAMRVGGRDFFSLPVGADDLIPALDRLAKEEHERHGGLSARVTTFMNAKGGSGASFCAANYAHILAKTQGRRTILLDFELQFGSLSTYFNLQSRNGLIRALELVDSLDVTALQGYTQQHPSGLYLLAAAAEGLVLPEDIHEDRVGKLFGVLDDAFEELVVDLPRRIDRARAAVLERSDLVILVVQQTVAHLQEIKRLASLLGGELGIAPDRLIVVVNRFQKRGEITLKDIAGALPGLRIETLPNDYQSVSQSVNLGVPLLDYDPRSSLCKSLTGLVQLLTTTARAPAAPRQGGPWAWLARTHL